MLLKTNISVIVDNDGVKNNSIIKTDVNSKYKDIVTSIKLGEKTLENIFQSYVISKYPNGVTSEQVKKIYDGITLEEIYKEIM